MIEANKVYAFQFAHFFSVCPTWYRLDGWILWTHLPTVGHRFHAISRLGLCRHLRLWHVVVLIVSLRTLWPSSGIGKIKHNFNRGFSLKNLFIQENLCGHVPAVRKVSIWQFKAVAKCIHPVNLNRWILLHWKGNEGWNTRAAQPSEKVTKLNFTKAKGNKRSLSTFYFPYPW